MIEVVEYDEAWPARAAAARAELIPLGVFGAVEHIGSTSVPGLAAKPVIDLMAAADSLDAVAAVEDALARLLRELAEPDEGGEAACFAHLVCPECGAVTTEGHRPGCALAATPGSG